MGRTPTPLRWNMNTLAYEFTAVQRRVLDRYTHFLGSLSPTFNNIPVVFARRRNSGHQLAVLAADSRLNNARFNERYLQEFWGVLKKPGCYAALMLKMWRLLPVNL